MNRRLGLLLMVLVAVLLVAVFAQQAVSPPAWAFSGAYADYSGNGFNTNLGGPEYLTGIYVYNLNLTVLSTNSSAAQVRISFSGEIGELAYANSSTAWVRFGTDDLIRALGGNGTYSTTAGIVEIDNAPTSVVEYVFRGPGPEIYTIYAGSYGGFPIGTNAEYGGGVSVSAYLVRTNIPGLST